MNRWDNVRGSCFRLFFIAALAGPAARVNGFDTGHHFDLTAAVLQERGFNRTSVEVAQLSNWLTDYYSNIGPATIKTECEKLHCDNLYSTKDVTWYWQQITSNASSATKQAATQGDLVKMLAVVGVTMHAVQDFYSHSNWVETHPRAQGGPYRSETWWSAGAPSNAELTTGKYMPYPKPPPPNVPEHGGYTSGLNKDSYIRPKWDEAYVFAYCACHELAAQMEVWANAAKPGFWNQVKALALNNADRSALKDDLVSAYQISLWVKGSSDADGHWKGNHSGSVKEFVVAGGKFVARSKSVFVKQFTNAKVQDLISQGLYSNSPPPNAPIVNAAKLKRNVIILRTTKVTEDKVGLLERKIDPGGTADFFAHVDFQGRRYVERTLQNQESFNDPWWTIHFADANQKTIPITLQVIDEDLIDGDDVCDINPARGKKSLSFEYLLDSQTLRGDVVGKHATGATAVKLQGKRPDQDRAVIQFYVTHAALK